MSYFQANKASKVKKDRTSTIAENFFKTLKRSKI